MSPTTFAFAEKIGTEIPRIGLEYCADDNTYTEYTFMVNAWACPVALSCEIYLPTVGAVAEMNPDELWAAMFG